MKYKIIRDYTEYHICEVEAESKDEALKLCEEGNVELNAFKSMGPGVSNYIFVGKSNGGD